MFLMLCGILQINAQIKDEEKTYIQGKDKIVYLFFKIDKSNSGSEKISLEEKKTVNGKLKAIPFFNEKSIKKGDLVITLLDSLGKENFKYNAKNPLNPEMESFGEKLGHQVSTLEKAEFSIRYSYSDETKIIKIEKITDTGKQLIFTQNL